MLQFYEMYAMLVRCIGARCVRAKQHESRKQGLGVDAVDGRSIFTREIATLSRSVRHPPPLIFRLANRVLHLRIQDGSG